MIEANLIKCNLIKINFILFSSFLASHIFAATRKLGKSVKMHLKKKSISSFLRLSQFSDDIVWQKKKSFAYYFSVGMWLSFGHIPIPLLIVLR